jgi:hypothetical protein
MTQAVREQVPKEHIDKLWSIIDDNDLLSIPIDFRIFLMGKVEPMVIPRMGKAATFH